MGFREGVRVRAVALVMSGLALQCSAPETGAPGSGDAGWSVTDDVGASDGVDAGETGDIAVPSGSACAEFGVEFERCAVCPAMPTTCECVGAMGVLLQTCGFGRCLAALDCERVCRNEAVPAFYDDFFELQMCLGTYECRSDADCGPGRCVGESPEAVGRCETGEPSAWCIDPSDCLGGICVAYQNPDATGGSCQAGLPGWPCDDDSHCLDGATCLLHGRLDESAAGVCRTGATGDRCLSDGDCDSGTCVAVYDDSAFRECAGRQTDDHCNDDGDCDSGFCFDHSTPDGVAGRCTTGGFRAHCMTGDDCVSGYCSQQKQLGASQPNVGTCVPGGIGDPCFTDAACESGVCALEFDSSEGICGGGGAGDYCMDDDDCLQTPCSGAVRSPAAECAGAFPGTPCETTGVCARGTCFHGRCAP